MEFNAEMLEPVVKAINDILRIFGLSLTQRNLAWGLGQIAVVLLAFALAKFTAKRIEPTIEKRIRELSLTPARLRLSAIFLRRVHLMIFVLLLWFSVSVFRAVTWDSRSFFLAAMASLASAWLVISIVSRVIRNRTLARIIAFVGWVLASLQILGILPQSIAIADEIAVQLGEFRLSILLVVQGVLLLSTLFWAAFFFAKLLDRQFAAFEDISPTMRVLIGKLSRFVLLALATLIGLSVLGIDFSALTLVSGAVGLGIGFGLQKVVSNLISGVILLLDRSIKPGDVISVGNTFGWITSLNARYASVTARDGREYLIPNEDLITQKVENWSFNDTFIRCDINFGASYNADPHEVRKIAVEAALSHQRAVKGVPDYKTVCHITGFGDNSVDYVLRFWISDPTNGITNIRGDVFLALWDAFKKHNIEIPYPHRHLMLDPSIKDMLAAAATADAKK